jgi:hypothetical protein
MKSLYFIIILIIVIFIIVSLSSYKKENMMEFVEPPAGVIISTPAMQLSYCSLNHGLNLSTDNSKHKNLSLTNSSGLKNVDIPDEARCYPYKCINKRGKITCRNEPCWIDEVYYNGEVKCGGYQVTDKKEKHTCDNKYNKNYDCTCKPDWESKKHNIKINKDKSIKKDESKNNTICIDPCTYRYYTTDDYPCDVHYIQAIEIEPNLNNYGDKICLINNDYEIRRKLKCDPLEVSLLKMD